MQGNIAYSRLNNGPVCTTSIYITSASPVWTVYKNKLHNVLYFTLCLSLSQQKKDPAQFLQVHGRAYKIHLDPAVALAAESPINM